jgi:hypothetical protein
MINHKIQELKRQRRLHRLKKGVKHKKDIFDVVEETVENPRWWKRLYNWLKNL